MQTAKAAGCPKDQIENFLRAGYVPLPWQLEFHAACRQADVMGAANELGAGGARGPGKSHSMLAQIALDDCQRFPGLRALMLRKILKAGKQSFDDLRKKLMEYLPHTYNRSTGELIFPNGSSVILGHFKDDRSFEAQIGLEYDEIGIEECTLLEANKYRVIRTCQRTPKAGWRPRTYSNSNPGSVGHAWYKRRFIEPWRAGTETRTRFFPGTYRDNPYLDEDYAAILGELIGWQRKAWKDGDWDALGGQFFSNWRSEVHVVKPFDLHVTGEFVFSMGLDYGWTHPTAAVILAKGANGDAFVVGEYSASKRLPAQHSREMLGMLAGLRIQRDWLRSTVIGADAFRTDRDGRCVADDYERLGWQVQPAQMRRVAGATEVLRRLGEPPDIKPSLYIFDTCPGLIRQLPEMQHDERRPEDILKVDVDSEGYGGDDRYDALRYALMELAKPITEYGPGLEWVRE